jgi:hypothetical protein
LSWTALDGWDKDVAQRTCDSWAARAARMITRMARYSNRNGREAQSV